MSAKPTSVLHAKKGDNHTVCISSLRVLMTEDDGGWYAQGIEIDYASFGETMEAAQRNFEKGFDRTIGLHLAKFGNLARMLRHAPEEEFAALLNAKAYKVEMVTMHDFGQADPARHLPYKNIAYLQASAA